MAKGTALIEYFQYAETIRFIIGRRRGKDFLTFLQHWSGAVTCPAFVWPLALMLCADRVPIESACPPSGPAGQIELIV